ncbi:MAG: translation initiation factor [Campylobacterales bacterium]
MSLADRLKNGLGGLKESGWKLEESGPKGTFEPLAPAEHKLHCRREKRKGKSVTLIGPFVLMSEELAALSKKLKAKLAAGGGIEDDFLLFQGECEAKLRELVKAEGFGFKR